MGLASGAATFVAVRAKSNHQRSKHTRGSTYAGRTHQVATAGSARGYAQAMPDPTQPTRRFPPPWTVEETEPCFIVRDVFLGGIGHDRGRTWR
jgi:hypothetical protein